MIALIAAETRKLTTVRTTWVLTLLGWALVALSCGALLFREELTGPFDGSDERVAVLLDQTGSASIVVLIVAILAATTEFRHGTIGRTLQLTPSRTRMLTAKMLTAAAYATAFFLSSLVILAVLAAAAGQFGAVATGIGPQTAAAFWQVPAGLALSAVFGVAIGALVRSQVVTITVTLVWLSVAENLMVGLAPDVGRWLPFQALNAVFLPSEAYVGVPADQLGPLTPVLALLVFLGYVSFAATGAGVLLRTRDV